MRPPPGVLIDARGEPRITDFGLAALAADPTAWLHGYLLAKQTGLARVPRVGQGLQLVRDFGLQSTLQRRLHHQVETVESAAALAHVGAGHEAIDEDVNLVEVGATSIRVMREPSARPVVPASPVRV